MHFTPLKTCKGTRLSPTPDMSACLRLKKEQCQITLLQHEPDASFTHSSFRKLTLGQCLLPSAPHMAYDLGVRTLPQGIPIVTGDKHTGGLSLVKICKLAALGSKHVKTVLAYNLEKISYLYFLHST